MRITDLMTLSVLCCWDWDLLLVAQLSFDRYDLKFIHPPGNNPVHNWIGPFGAYGAYGLFFVFGGGGYVISLLMLLFGFGACAVCPTVRGIEGYGGRD